MTNKVLKNRRIGFFQNKGDNSNKNNVSKQQILSSSLAKGYEPSPLIFIQNVLCLLSVLFHV